MLDTTEVYYAVTHFILHSDKIVALKGKMNQKGNLLGSLHHMSQH